MAPIFPGMNPYLERPSLWSEVHSWLMVELARTLNPLLIPHYRAEVEKRVYMDMVLVGIPDASVLPSSGDRVTRESLPLAHGATATAIIPQPIRVQLPIEAEITERYLEIREVKTEQVVTVVEVLSPKNKRSGEGRQQYLAKRQTILSSATHLVEIDLLRRGEIMPIMGAIASDYQILISRSELRPDAELFPFNLRAPIPQFALPLGQGAEEPIVNLNQILQQVYEQAALDLAIDYTAQPDPPLSDQDFQWVQTFVGSG